MDRRHSAARRRVKLAYHYSDTSRESDPHAQPDLEVFHLNNTGPYFDPLQWNLGNGWYYAFGFPGCLWDSDPVGPFDTEAEALADARGES